MDELIVTLMQGNSDSSDQKGHYLTLSELRAGCAMCSDGVEQGDRAGLKAAVCLDGHWGKMLAVTRCAYLIGEFGNLLVRGEAGDGEQVGRGVDVRGGSGCQTVTSKA